MFMLLAVLLEVPEGLGDGAAAVSFQRQLSFCVVRNAAVDLLGSYADLSSFRAFGLWPSSLCSGGQVWSL